MSERERVEQLARRVTTTVRPVLGRAKRAVLRRARPVAPAPIAAAPAPAPVPVAPAERPRPLPAGWTEPELREVMHSISVDGSAPGELSPYVDDAFWRFLQSWGLVHETRGTALELAQDLRNCRACHSVDAAGPALGLERGAGFLGKFLARDDLVRTKFCQVVGEFGATRAGRHGVAIA